MEFDQIASWEGTPPRPAFLLKPASTDESSPQLVARLLLDGMTVVVGGVSIIGAKLTVVPIISIVRLQDGMLHGWALAIGHPTKPLEFTYFDVAKGMPSVFMADTMVYFIAVTDAILATEAASQDDLIAIARYAFAFISDNGPPKDIDW